MKPFSRGDRVGELIQRNVSEILHKRISDPRLENVIITNVKMSADIKLATIYFVTQPNRKDEVIAGFKKAHGFIKRILAKELSLRYMPELRFYYDSSFDVRDRIEKLLKAVKPEDAAEKTEV